MALNDLLRPYNPTQVARGGQEGLWAAMTTEIVCDASVLPPDPVSDARYEEICAEEARRALISHLATI